MLRRLKLNRLRLKKCVPFSPNPNTWFAPKVLVFVLLVKACIKTAPILMIRLKLQILCRNHNSYCSDFQQEKRDRPTQSSIDISSRSSKNESILPASLSVNRLTLTSCETELLLPERSAQGRLPEFFEPTVKKSEADSESPSPLISLASHMVIPVIEP